MDNQLALDLAWLGGIMDADGCFCIPVSQKKKTMKAFPEAKMANVNEMIIAETVSILSKLGIAHHIRQRTAKRSHKVVTTIRIKRLNPLAVFLETIIPFVRGKKGQATLLKAFVDSRLRRTGGKYNARWNNEEKSIVDQVRFLNQKGRRSNKSVNDCTVSTIGHAIV